MKRLISLIVAVTMLAAFAAPAALANTPTQITLVLLPKADTPAQLRPGDTFTLEVHFNNPEGRAIAAIGDATIGFDARVLEWDIEGFTGDAYETGGKTAEQLPFRRGSAGQGTSLEFIAPSTIYNNSATHPVTTAIAPVNAHFNFSTTGGSAFSGVLFEVDLRVKSGAINGSSRIYLNVGNISGVNISGVGMPALVARTESYSVTIVGGVDAPPPTPTPAPEYTLNRAAGANGSVSGTSNGDYAAGAAISLTATPNPGFIFVNWTGSGLAQPSYTANPLNFNMPSSNVALTANFEAVPTNSVTVNGTSIGSFAQGAEVTINAGQPPAAGHTFAHWTVVSGGITIPGTASATFTMPGIPVSVNANWNSPDTVTYTVTVDSTVIGSFKEGDTVQIHAGTRSGHLFNGWTVVSGGVTLANANAASTSFTMPAGAVAVSANWKLDAPADGGTGPDPKEGVVVEYKKSRADMLGLINSNSLLLLDDNMDVIIYFDIPALKHFTAASEGDMTALLTKNGDIYELEVTVGSAKLTGFGGGHVTVGISYELNGADQNSLVAYRVKDGGAQELLRCKYDFEYAVFTSDSPLKFTFAQKPVSFQDRGAMDSWMVPHISFVASRGLFAGNAIPGSSERTFNPRGNIKYGELAAVLANYDGQSQVLTNWPSDHINWAVNKGIFNGVADYSANRDVTRADMAQMIYNYSKAAGVTLFVHRDFTFSDIAGSPASEAIIALANAGVISGDTGSGGALRPNDKISRAQVAAIISQFVKAFQF